MQRMAQDGLLGALIRGMPAARLEREALFEPLLLSHNLMIMDVPAHQPFAHQYMQAGGLGSDCMSRHALTSLADIRCLALLCIVQDTSSQNMYYLVESSSPA